MLGIFGGTDILVDCTQRRDASIPVVPNGWIAALPGHAVIADLCVDPYLPADTPPVVRGIEGIPRGNLDKYRFMPTDPDWMSTIPPGVPCTQRRPTVTCYSWPGVHPVASMERYGTQLLPLVLTLIRTGYGALSAAGDYYQRAVYRGSLRAFLADR
jgi:alanine dehydrogenase